MLASDIFEYIQELNSLEKKEIVLEMKEVIEVFKDKHSLTIQDIPDRVRGASIVYCDGNMDEALEELEEVIEEFNSSPSKYILNMKLLLDDYCTYGDLCPECGQELIYDSWQEQREYAGMNCSESMSELICRDGCNI
ncbi:MAG: hypothetical protein ACRCX8_08690 [Sarcina sp.]